MKIIVEMVYNYAFLFDLINVIALILNLLMLLPKNRVWHDYIICFYGGFLAGIVILFVSLESIFVACFGSVCCSLLLIYLHNKFNSRIYIPFVIILFKILLVFGMTIFEKEYSLHMFHFYVILMLVSVLVFFVVTIMHKFSQRQKYYLVKLFALLETSGVIVQLYRRDYVSFVKFLDNRTDSVSFFLYLLRVDFWIFDYQYLYILCFLFLLFGYAIFIHSIKFFKTNKTKI